MKPIVDVDTMRECDQRTLKVVGPDSLLRAAGFAVALEAHDLLGSLYGRRVALLCGPGLNGRDGRFAAHELIRRGARATVIEVREAPPRLTGVDLVIDAAFGIGCSREYLAPAVDAPVLAVDLPSGVDADTGELRGQPLHASRTLALGALKWAHVDGPAAPYCGEIRLARLGIHVPDTHGLLESSDLARVAPRSPSDHKWRHAVQIVAGSSAMPGAALLACQGALAGGASLVRLTPRTSLEGPVTPAEVIVSTEVDTRVQSLVVGPGLGPHARGWLETLTWPADAPVVLDADALRRRTIEIFRSHPVVLTPHEGEFTRLTKRPLGAQRIPAVQALARELNVVVLLKGPRTIIASPEGHVRVVVDSSPTLATAGSGDTLSGVIGALLAYGHTPFEAASLGAELHGLSGRTWPLASDLAHAVHLLRLPPPHS